MTVIHKSTFQVESFKVCSSVQKVLCGYERCHQKYLAATNNSQSGRSTPAWKLNQVFWNIWQ